ncbi:MAG TPA: efflux RND transporter permease subunit, partial [Allocoleopsis sp.]
MVEPVRPPSARSRFNFSRWAIAHPYLTLCFWIGVCVAGVLAFSSLKYALFPDITFPVVVVNASAPLKTALDTEQQLTKSIEQALQGVNYTDLSSTTYPGRSVVSLRFQVGTDLQKSTRTVEAALQPIKLPDKADFNVLPINLNEAIVASYTLQSDAQTLETLSKTAKTEIIPSIAALPNVLRVDLLGVPLPATSNPIAAFQAAQKEKATLVRFNGKPALAFQVVKQSDANTLEVVRQVNQHIRQLRQKFPQINWAVASTQADYIRAATRATMSALFEAIALSVIVILPFLRSWRATVISALAIPT